MYLYLLTVGNFCVSDRNHYVEIIMESDQTAKLPCDSVVSDDVSEKPVNIDMSSAADAGIVKSECCAKAFETEIETNGKCPEQLEMMVVKDGVPHVRSTKYFAEVLSLGCNCRQPSTLRGDVVMAVMLLSNMLNYMDRFTIVGMYNLETCISYILFYIVGQKGDCWYCYIFI